MSQAACAECIEGNIVSTDGAVTTSKRLLNSNKPGRVGLILHNAGTVDLWYDFNSTNSDGSVASTSKAGVVAPGTSVPLPLGDGIYLKGVSSTGASVPYCIREF